MSEIVQSRRIFFAIAAFILGLTAFFQLFYIQLYAVNIPYWDEWLLVASDASIPAVLNSEWLLHQHMEHRIAFTRLISWINYKLFDFNVRYQILANFFLYLTVPVSLLYFMRQLKLSQPLALSCVSCVFLLTARLRDNHLWGFQSQFHFCLLFILWASYLLMTDRKDLLRTFVASCFAVFAMFSFSAGVVGVLALSMVYLPFKLGDSVLKRGHPDRIRHLTQCGLFLSLTLTALVIYFYDYKTVGGHPDWNFPWGRTFWDFFFNLVSFAFGFESIANFPGIMVCLIIVLPLFLLAGPYRQSGDQLPWLLGCFAVIISILCVVAAGRSGFGIDQSKTSRYLEFSILLIPLVWVAWSELLARSQQVWVKLVLLVTVLLTGWGYRSGFNFAEDYQAIYKARISGVQCLELHRFTPGPFVCQDVYPLDLSPYLESARGMKLSFYDDLREPSSIE